MFDRLIAAVRTTLGRLRPEGSLTTQTVKSAVWSGGTVGGTRLLQLTMTVVLARILGPEEFGLMGIAVLAYQGLERLSRTGIDRALVQRREEDVTAFFDTAWAIQVGRGVLIAGVLFASAPLVASVFGEPRVTRILRVIALSPLISAALNPSIVYFDKDLDLHKKFAYEMSGAGTRFVVAVALALAFESVWALVFGFLAADVARLVASYALDSYRPGLDIRLDQAKELFGYGKWITATSAITFLLVSGDDALVGWLLTTSALGLYRLGYRFGKTPTMEVSSALSNVVFPLYSKLQSDADALADAACKTVRMLSLVSFPAAVGIVVTARPFVEGVVGDQWLPVVPVMQIAAVYGAFSSFTSAFNDIWNAIGRPDLNTKINVLRLVLTGAVIYPATVRYGITGTVGAIAGVFILVVVPLKIHVAVESVETSHRRLLSELLYPAVASGVMGGVLLGVRRTVSPLSAVVEFAVLVPVGVAVYLGAVVLVEAQSGWEIGDDIRTILGVIRG